MAEIHRRYAAKFGNVAEVAPPEILADPKLCILMAGALESGYPLTETGINLAFACVDWERCIE